MSYDVAVWEGEMPADDEQALETYANLGDRYGLSTEPPTERILGYLKALTAHYPDAFDQADGSPWAVDPLTTDAAGPFVVLPVQYGRADEVLPVIAETARTHGLVLWGGTTWRNR